MPKPRVFVLMPFRDELAPIYYEVIKPTLESIGYDVARADDLGSQRNIMRDIVEAIEGASLVVADLTGRNANVMYELGVAHALRKPTLVVSQSLSDVPFDLQGYRVTAYSAIGNALSDFKSQLIEVGLRSLEGRIRFGNPVIDFAKTLVPERGDRDRIQKIQAAATTAGRALVGATAELMVLDDDLEKAITAYDEARQQKDGDAGRQLFAKLGANQGQREAALTQYKKQAAQYYSSIEELVATMDLAQADNVRGVHLLRDSLQNTLGISKGFTDAARMRRDQLLELGADDEAIQYAVPKHRASYDELLAAVAVNDATIERLTNLVDATLAEVDSAS